MINAQSSASVIFRTTQMEIEHEDGFRVHAQVVMNDSWALPEICWPSLKVFEWSSLSSKFIETTAVHKRNQQSKTEIEKLLISEFSKQV